MSNKIVKPLTVAIGAAFVGSLALTQTANASTAFQITPLVAGYTLAGEGKCGEGKCAVAKMAKPGEKAVSKDEAMAHGFSESQVMAWDKNKDNMLDESELMAMHKAMDKKGMMHKKGKEGSCSADKKGKEGSCSADKKGKEGSCSGR
jgi:uncharacterized low-complexity protein